MILWRPAACVLEMNEESARAKACPRNFFHCATCIAGSSGKWRGGRSARGSGRKAAEARLGGILRRGRGWSRQRSRGRSKVRTIALPLPVIWQARSLKTNGRERDPKWIATACCGLCMALHLLILPTRAELVGGTCRHAQQSILVLLQFYLSNPYLSSPCTS